MVRERTVRRGAILALLLVAAATTACGGSGRDEARDYRDRADAACRRSQEGFARLPSPEEPTQLVRYLRGSLDLQRRLERDLRAIEPPPELAEDHATLTAAARDQAVILDRLVDTLADDGGQAFARQYAEQRPKLDELIQRGEQAADELRLGVCRST